MVLDWQHEFEKISHRGYHLLQTGKLADVRFLVGGTPSTQKIFVGHKLILAIASPVFESMFYGAMPEREDPIVIPDVQPDAFRAMLEYIYSDLATIGSFDKACALCCVANKYMLPHLVKQCTEYMIDNLSPKNACRAYELAKLFDESSLMKRSMKFIRQHTAEVLADPSFTDIEATTLMCILDQDELKIKSELELFNAVQRFADKRVMFKKKTLQSAGQQHCENDSSVADGAMLHVEEIEMKPDTNAMFHGHDESSIKDETVVTPEDFALDPACSKLLEQREALANANAMMQGHDGNLIEDVKKAVKKIRFLSMSPKDFALGPARSKLLEQHEAFAILLKLSCLDDIGFKMPEGFCTARRGYITNGSTRRTFYSSEYDSDYPYD